MALKPLRPAAAGAPGVATTASRGAAADQNLKLARTVSAGALAALPGALSSSPQPSPLRSLRPQGGGGSSESFPLLLGSRGSEVNLASLNFAAGTKTGDDDPYSDLEAGDGGGGGESSNSGGAGAGSVRGGSSDTGSWRTYSAACYAWLAAHADEIDFWLLILSLMLTAAGGLLLTPVDWSGANGAAERPVHLRELTAGMALLWSLGAPICDVLAVSLFSVIYSSVRPSSSQAAYMGYVSAAGSIGRIAYPATVGLVGLTGDMLFVAATNALCVVATFWFFLKYPSVPGAGWARQRWL
jgi:hypothetical protein